MDIEKDQTEHKKEEITSADTKASNKAKKNTVTILLAVIAGLVFLAIAYFIVGKINTPAKVKEKAVVTQTAFIEYQKGINKIANHLKDDSGGSDSDSLEREIQKGKDLIETAKSTNKTLKVQVENINLNELQNYKDKLEEYLAKSDQLILLEVETLEWAEQVIDPIKTYEDASVEVSGASNYMYSDPSKYTEILEEFVTKDRKLIKELENIKIGASLKDVHKPFIAHMKSELKLIEELSKAVENRSTSAIADAQKVYAQEAQKNDQDLNREQDKLDEIIEDLSDEVEDLGKEIESEYTRLQAKYGF